MATEPSGCPFCQSHDLRTLYRDAELTSYRCHDCERTVHVQVDRTDADLRKRGDRNGGAPERNDRPC